jgi:hypothetical protein
MSNLSRRSLVTSAAALPALAVPAVAIASIEPDPIFAAIEKERALNTAFLARCHYEDDLAETGVKLAPAPGEYSQTPEMVAVVNAGITARVELANTAPTTPSGLVAYLDYVLVESERLSTPEVQVFFFDDHDAPDFIRSLWRSATALAVQS